MLRAHDFGRPHRRRRHRQNTVAKMFKQCGAAVIDADQLAHDSREARQTCLAPIVKPSARPSSILTAPSIAVSPRSPCFRKQEKLRQLERIIHPRVAREQQRLVRRIATRKPNAVVIYEVPLLFEVGVDKRVDKTIVVTADRNTQIARLKKRNGFSGAEAIRRIRSQMPLDKENPTS